MLTIRKCTLADASDAFLICSRTTPDSWRLASFQSELSNPHFTGFLAIVGGESAGFAGAHCVADECSIVNIGVLPEFRRRGVAAALLLAVEHAAAGAANIYLEVRVSNAGAIALYESCGYKNTGKRPMFYRNPDEDALLFCKSLH